MKITEKIVTSVTPPQYTNVLWHNPKTGELKMYYDYEGGVTFVFAGSGHFVGKDSVFEIMKEKGDLIF